MRTIKFRAKDLDGEWCYGFYVEEERQTINGFEKKHFIVNDGYSYVNPDTVGQFTGLLDKDGKEIYEGDIIFSQKCDCRAILHKVEYNEENAMFVAKPIQGWDFDFCQIRKDWIDKYGKEVIGNIHDNPELLNKNNNQKP